VIDTDNIHDEIPEWLSREEKYVPSKDKDRFTARTALSVFSVMSGIRRQGARERSRIHPVLRLLNVFFVLILLALSRNLMFPAVIFSCLLVRLALLDAGRIARILKGTAAAVVISAVCLLPAALMGSTRTFFYVTMKLAASVTLLGIVGQTSSWNQITSGLSVLRVPDLFIFVLDTALKYILLLGEECAETLMALKIRCIGSNKDKAGAFGGALGVTALKAREMSEEMAQAMECRGFDGRYVITRKKTAVIPGLLYIGMMAVMAVIYFELERG